MPEFLRKIWHSLIDKLSAILRFVCFSFIPRKKVLRSLLLASVFICTLAVGFYALPREMDFSNHQIYQGGQLEALAAPTPEEQAALDAAEAEVAAAEAEAAKKAEAEAAAKKDAESTPATSPSAPAAPNDGGGGLLNDVIMLFNSVLFAICRMLGWVALKIFALIVLVSSYNDFITSAAVTKGWALLRDICNLFLVLILLVVAFAMILRVKEYGSTQMLFFVIRAAILINFSKLICGLIIDFAQVVMMTFVNGYAATAGANLIEGLGLANLMAFGNTGSDAVGSFDIFLTLWIAIFILIMTIIVTFFILLLLLLRIVQLWILVVTSPLAFMGKSVPVKKLQAYCGKWWDSFTGTVMVGPLMAFFLWLSLLVMSNPQDLMIAGQDGAAKIEAQSKGANSGMGSLGVQPMIQASIGLCMLLAGLMAAKEAGGVVGSMGGDFAKYATSAAKAVGGKMTGYSQVKDRTVAAYKGWEGQAKKKKEMAMAKYTRFGEAAFAKKEGVIATGKTAAMTPLALATAGVRAGINKLTGKPANFAENFKRAQARSGRINTMVKDSIEQDHAAKRRAEAEKELDARGVKTPDDLRGVMMDQMESKDVRKAAALKLKGKYKSADDARMAKDLIAGDRTSAKEFDDAMDKEQAHLVYDMKDDKKRDDFIKKLKEGKITLGSQKEDFFKSPGHLQAAMDALGADRFNAQMQGVVKKGSIVHQDAIKDALQKLNGEIAAGEKEMKTSSFVALAEEEQEKFKAALQKKKDMAKPMRGAMATVTSDLSQVFATTGADGQPDLMHDELKTHLKYASGKDLVKKDIREKDPNNPQLADGVVVDLAAVISKKQMKDMAASKTEGAAPKVEIVIKQMLENYDNEVAKGANADAAVVSDYERRLADCHADPRISECLGQELKDRLAGVQLGGAGIGGGVSEGDEVRWTREERSTDDDGKVIVTVKEMTGDVIGKGENGQVIVATKTNPRGFAMDPSKLNKVPVGEPVEENPTPDTKVKWKSPEGLTINGVIGDPDKSSSIAPGQVFVKTKDNPNGFAISINKLRNATPTIDPERQAKVDAAAKKKTELA